MFFREHNPVPNKEGCAMLITNCDKGDFDQIINDVEDFWGSRRTACLHHPMFLYEFGNTAYVVKENGRVLAYLFGFLSQTGPLAYIHLVAVRQSHRRHGLGCQLFEHFADYARKKGCQTIKAITSPDNVASVAFHRRLGMEISASVKDYSGPGIDRIVLIKAL
ncbi:MAG: GNAT family N-acetyltransferase [Dehalococcoidia bacterium]|nr:MAG: GNAT family N-acetyltransferase [Dehalococcoidia bacterium]